MFAYANGSPACTCPKGGDCPDAGKHPRLAGWPSEATADEEAIVNLWERWPISNLGVLLGPASGIVDVEFDNDEGEATAKRLLGDCFTPTYRSARGTHRLFAFPVGFAIGKAVVKVQGLEIRFGTDNKGAQSVMPPSVHASGCLYRWTAGLSPDEVEPAPFPDALAELLAHEGNGKGNGEFVAEGHFWETDGSAEGERYDALGRLTGRYLQAFGCESFDNLLGHAFAWNAKCQPPEDEATVRKHVEHIWRKENAKRVASAQATAVQPTTPQAFAKPRLILRRYSDVEAKPIDWLWPHRLPVGMVTIVAGFGGWGKSTVMADVAARLSVGKAFPDGSPCSPGDSLILSAEESPEYVIKQRLLALGADCERIHDVSCILSPNGEERPLTLPGDAEILREVLREFPKQDCWLSIRWPMWWDRLTKAGT